MSEEEIVKLRGRGPTAKRASGCRVNFRKIQRKNFWNSLIVLAKHAGVVRTS